MVHAQSVGHYMDADVVLQGEAAVVAALPRFRLDHQQAISADAIARVQPISLQLLLIPRPLWACEI